MINEMINEMINNIINEKQNILQFNYKKIIIKYHH
jgi:hypothetical protein